jgi:CRP-like cAMP-binding protein
MGVQRDPGSLVAGWSAFKPPYRYTSSTRCEEASEMIRLPRDTFEEIFGKDPYLGYRILKKVAAAVDTGSKRPSPFSRRLRPSRTGHEHPRAPARVPVFRGGGTRAPRALRRPRPERDVRAGRGRDKAGGSRNAFYVLDSGKIELSFAKAGAELGAPAEEAGPETEGHTLPHLVGHRGYPVGWASLVEPHRYRATAVARERTEMLVLARDLFEAYAEERPDFGLAFMRRVLWLIGNHLRMTRTRLVAARYGNVPQTVRALLDQNAATLSVASALHKIPTTWSTASPWTTRTAPSRCSREGGDEVERELAAQISDLLDEVWREVPDLPPGCRRSTTWWPARRPRCDRRSSGARAARSSPSSSRTPPT